MMAPFTSKNIFSVVNFPFFLSEVIFQIFIPQNIFEIAWFSKLFLSNAIEHNFCLTIKDFQLW